mgnify:CR=1 FL=1
MFQRQQFRACPHGSAHNNDRRDIDPCQTHQVCRHSLITAGNKDASVKWGRIGVDLDHIRDHLTACKAEIDAIGSLTFTITDIGAVIPGTMPARILNSLAGSFDQFVQMSASRVAVAKGAFHDDLRL